MAQNSIARLAVQIITDTRPMAAGFNQARTQVAQFAGSMGTATTGAGRLAGAASSLGGALGAAGVAAAAAVAIGALAKFGATGIAVAAQMEQLQISFEVMTGSAKTAASLISDLRALSAETPLDFTQVNTAAKTLLAMGEDTRAVIDEIKMLGDVASGSGQPLNELAQVFGQVMQAGRLTGNELRQFNERGVPVLTTLAEMMGVSKQAIRDMVEEGQVSFGQVVAAFEKMTGAGGRFANMMARQTDTLVGQWNKLKENASIIAGEAMKPLAESAKQVLMSFNEILDITLRWMNVERLRKSTTADKEAVARIREQEAALRDTEKAAAETAKAEKDRMDDLKKRAESIEQSLRTPFEIFQDTLRELKGLGEAGLISNDILERGAKKAAEEYMRATENVKKLKDEVRLVPSIEQSSGQFRAAFLSNQRNDGVSTKKTEDTALLKRIAKATEAELGRPVLVFKKGEL